METRQNKNILCCAHPPPDNPTQRKRDHQRICLYQQLNLNKLISSPTSLRFCPFLSVFHSQVHVQLATTFHLDLHQSDVGFCIFPHQVHSFPCPSDGSRSVSESCGVCYGHWFQHRTTRHIKQRRTDLPPPRSGLKIRAGAMVCFDYLLQTHIMVMGSGLCLEYGARTTHVAGGLWLL